MGFAKDSAEFVACMKFLGTIKRKKKYSDNISVTDLVFPLESPRKTLAIEDKKQEEANSTVKHEKFREEEEALTALTKDKDLPNTTKIALKGKETKEKQQVPQRPKNLGT